MIIFFASLISVLENRENPETQFFEKVSCKFRFHKTQRRSVYFKMTLKYFFK
jgi:hypothetical protein